MLFGNLNSVRPIGRTSCAWRFRNFRAYADIAIRFVGKCVNTFCFHPASFEVCFAEDARVERSSGAGIATTAGHTSVELEDPLVNPSVRG